MLDKLFKSRSSNANSTSTYETNTKTIEDVIQSAQKSSDFKSEQQADLMLYYFETLIDQTLLQQSILANLNKNSVTSLQELYQIIPLANIEITADGNKVEQALHLGAVALQLKNNATESALITIYDQKIGVRDKNETENEFSVIGPKIGFVEEISTNLHLLRSAMVSTDLIFEEHIIGSRSHTKVVIAYIEGVTNPTFVETVRQRLTDLDIDLVSDNTKLEQLISDHSNTIFPLYITTERVDRTVNSLAAGHVAIIADHSPYVVTGPATLIDFFASPEDQYLPWVVASFFMFIRMLSVIFSIFASALYVALFTFHMEVVPKDLLGPIIFSRANVPFPPAIEVLFLEITIELLREAGARLPTKIGQTLGIVGGIVIGQATVEAALTSNILLIVVALGALASFTTPIYKMSNAVRLLRYPFILLAGLWGGFGIFIGILLLLTHLMRLQSFGSPYLLPVYPYRKKGYTAFFRPNYSKLGERSPYLRVLKKRRYSPKTNKDPVDGLNSE